jgi:starch synthase
MYSMRYGTVPVVHAVGGLYDTVIDATVDSAVASEGQRRASGTGFVFEVYSPGALLDALRRALAVFEDKRKWQALQVAGMQQDFSWDRSAAEYVKIYDRVRAVRR